MSERQQNLQSILRWSLQQQGDGTTAGGAVASDTERRAWLKDALETLSQTPSETDILKAALSVLKAYPVPSALDCSEGEIEEAIVQSLEQLSYLVEDIDHAKDLVALGGVPVMTDYTRHPNKIVCAKACEVIGLSTQNNLKCQVAFQSAIPGLITLCGSHDHEAIQVKSLFAISCVVRDFPSALDEFIRHSGLDLINCCLQSAHLKLCIKALFLLSYISSSIAEHITGDLIGEVTKLVTDAEVDDVRRHSTFCLLSLVRVSPQQISSQLGCVLRTALEQRMHNILIAPEHEDELAACKELLNLLPVSR